MKFGVTTYIWTVEFNLSHLSLLPRIKEGGFDGLEMPLFHPKGFPAAEIRRGVEAYGLECTASVVLTDGLSLISEDPEVRRKTHNHLVDTIQVAAEAGARIIAGPVYSPVGYLTGRRRTTDEWNRAVEGYQSLAETLAANGVTLAIEPLNRFETYFLNTAADAAALCDQVGHPNVGILFDTFHANIEEKDIAAGYRTVGRHLKHVHTCENDRGTPGSGHVEWNEVFQALRDLHYDGWLVIEGFSFALGELSTAACLWRDIEVTPEVIAFEGVKFLRRNMA
jgi:D-psicose/D-tagatose/L-ribulose 3-epimerase